MTPENRRGRQERGARAALSFERPQAVDEPPPLGGSWVRLYALVLGELAVLIALFAAFTGAFR